MSIFVLLFVLGLDFDWTIIKYALIKNIPCTRAGSMRSLLCRCSINLPFNTDQYHCTINVTRTMLRMMESVRFPPTLLGTLVRKFDYKE